MKHHARPSALLTVAGIGLIPFAPGTWGSAVTAAVIGALAQAMTGGMAFWLVSFLLLGIRPLALAELREVARLMQGSVDHPSIVIDEVIGMGVTLLPALLLERASWDIVTIGFVLFRLFDIVKPFGIKKIDDRNTPVSVLADDLVAGVFAAVGVGIAMAIL